MPGNTGGDLGLREPVHETTTDSRTGEDDGGDIITSVRFSTGESRTASSTPTRAKLFREEPDAGKLHVRAARYVGLNPVRARLAARAWDWPHSSVRAHLAGRDDGLVSVRPLLDRAPRFVDLLELEADQDAFGPLRRSEVIGRPLGSAAFVAGIEKRLGRSLAPGKRGRKPRKEGAVAEDNQVKTGMSP